MRLSAKQKKAMRDERVCEEQWAKYVRARDNGHTKYLEMARKCNQFYVGDQWDPRDVAKLDSQGRPHLTINMVLATVNAVIAEQLSKRADFRYKAGQGGSSETADTLTKLVKAIRQQNDYETVESEVFQDGIIQHGRGYFDIRMDFSKNIQGDVVITSDDSQSIVLDPDAKEYDPDTWTEVFETKWLSLQELEDLYGKKKADAVKQLAINGHRLDPDSILWEDEPAFGDARSAEADTTYSVHYRDGEERSIRSVRVLERQHAKYHTVQEFVDTINGDRKEVPPTWSDKKIEEFADQHGLAVVPVVKRRIRWTITADKVVLHDDWSPYQSFTKIPYFCYFRRGKPFGIITNLISPQEQLNKLSSQELHIVNTTANSGWMVEEGALSSMTPDDLRNQGAETGLVITVNKGRLGGVEKITPNSVPTGIERLSLKASQYVRTISGVNDAMIGTDGPQISGVALEQQTEAGQSQLKGPLENLNRTRHLVSRKILELVQQFFTAERVFHMVSDDLDVARPDEAEEVVINRVNAAGEIINDITAGEYKTVLSIAPSRDTFNDLQFAEIVNLRTLGIAVPDDRIVELSNIARKEALAQEIRDIQGRGELTEQQQAQLQFEQMISQELAILEVRKAEAEVMEKQAKAAELAAEASQKEGGINSPEMQMRMNDIQKELVIARENLQLRRDLANITAQSRLDSDVLRSRGQLMTDSNKAAEERHTQAVIAQLKPPSPKEQ